MAIKTLTSVDFDQLVFDKWIKVYGLGRTDSDLRFVFKDIQDGGIENTEDTSFLTGAGGINLMALKRNKAATVNFNNAKLVISAMGAQTGSNAEYASAQNKLVVPVYETIKATSATAAELTDTPIAGSLKYVYPANRDGSADLKNVYELASTTPTGKQFTLSGKALTFPASSWEIGDSIIAIYEKEVTVGVKVSNRSDTSSDTVYLIGEALAFDPCDQGTQYIVRVVMPNASVDGNFNINIGSDTPEPHAFSAQSLPDPCGDGSGELWHMTIA